MIKSHLLLAYAEWDSKRWENPTVDLTIKMATTKLLSLTKI